MATKYDIASWKDGLESTKKRKAGAYQRLAIFQSRGDDIKCDETYAHIAHYNNLIDAFEYELARANKLETA